MNRLRRVRFSDLPRFRPYGTPSELLAAGVFGGEYFHKADPAWVRRVARADPDLARLVRDNRLPERDPERNAFGVLAGKDERWWLQRKLISEHDPLGWFQWYVNFYLGRRLPEEDDRQVSRWYSYGARHGARLRSLGDAARYPRARQALIQWAHPPF